MRLWSSADLTVNHLGLLSRNSRRQKTLESGPGRICNGRNLWSFFALWLLTTRKPADRERETVQLILHLLQSFHPHLLFGAFVLSSPNTMTGRFLAYLVSESKVKIKIYRLILLYPSFLYKNVTMPFYCSWYWLFSYFYYELEISFYLGNLCSVTKVNFTYFDF